MNDKPTRRKGITLKQLDQAETMLYDQETEAIHILNPAATLIWDLCDGEHTPEDMVATVKTKFAGTEGRDILSDVQRTLDTFAEKGLLQVDS